jgi:hypothetical protein
MPTETIGKTKKTIHIILMIIVVMLFSMGYQLPKDNISSSFADLSNIYLKDSLLFISDEETGISIYSVSNMSAPKKMAQILLQGHSGLAVRGDMLYANSYTMILALKLNSDFTCDTVCKLGKTYSYTPIDYHEPRRRGFFNCSAPLAADCIGSGSGTGGSYAIFAVIDSFLYYIDDSNLRTMDISNPDTIIELSRTYIDWTIETLYPTERHLFVGGRGGMYVFSRGNPAKPTKIGMLQHFQAYDPVVVKDSTAYVTLRKGNFANSRDVLLVVNIADLTNPKVISEVSTPTPYGLAIHDTLLYVSNGYNGMSLYNVSEPDSVIRIKYFHSEETKDFIWYGDVLYTMCFNYVMLLGVTDPLDPQVLARIY